MANDRTTIIIDADASGVSSAVNKAEQSLGRLGGSVENQSKSLNRYGEKLGKAFGPGEGLHGRISELETPLRDSEGAFARAQMAAIEFGNKGATAADKVGAGFLLASDSIAAFASGGYVGLAIAAAVTGFSLLTNEINKQEQASKEAEEATKKQAEALQDLAKSANAANVTISLLNAQNREKETRERIRFIDEERRDVKARYFRLRKIYDANEEEFNKLRTGSRKRELRALTETQSAELDKIKKQFDKLNNEYSFSDEKIRKARANVEKEMRENSENEITRLIASLEKKVEAGSKAIQKASGTAARVVTDDDIMTRYATEQKAAEEAQQALRKEDEAFEERQLQKQEAAKKRFLDNQELQRQETIAAWDAADQAKKADEDRIRSAEQAAAKRMAAFQKAHSVEIAAVSATIGALQQMAHDGEISFSKLADAAVTAAGNQLVADGTKVLMSGVAKLFNPVTAAIGGAEAAQGGLMISAGLGMGAVGGFIGRSGAATTPANAAASSAPTDTRESRSAASSGDSGGGTTIVNFNGPAYDRRAVGQVINSGMKMARHRRIAGA